ncbi:MAG: hypothetical protein RL654_584 [Pseudomonadota bacterium]
MWAALAGSLVFWGLRLGVRPGGLPPQVQTVATDQAVRGDVLRMLGAVPAAVGLPATAPEAAARFRLIGAVARSGGEGWAMLAIDGQPARVVRVGAAVDSRWVLQSVSPRQIALGPAGAPTQLTLDLPQLPPPATGVPGQQGTAAVPPPTGVMPEGMQPVPTIQVPQAMPPGQAGPDGVMPGQPPIIQTPPEGTGTVSGGVEPPAVR